MDVTDIVSEAWKQKDAEMDSTNGNDGFEKQEEMQELHMVVESQDEHNVQSGEILNVMVISDSSKIVGANDPSCVDSNNIVIIEGSSTELNQGVIVSSLIGNDSETSLTPNEMPDSSQNTDPLVQNEVLEINMSSENIASEVSDSSQNVTEFLGVSSETIDSPKNLDTAQCSQEKKLEEVQTKSFDLEKTLNTLKEKETSPKTNDPEINSDDMSEEEAHSILMKALHKISPKIGKNFVLMFKDPSTSEVKEIASDKGKQFLQHNVDVVKKFSSICTDELSEQPKETDDDENGETSDSVNDPDESTVDEENDKMSEASKISMKRNEVKPVKRAPRTTVIMNKLAKIEEKQRLKNLQTFSCDHCPSKFGTSGNLKKHLKNKHNIGAEVKNDLKEKTDVSSEVTEFCDNLQLKPNEKEKSKSVTLRMEDNKDFETVVIVPDTPSVSNVVNTPSTAEKKRGRGRPPKTPSTPVTIVEEDKGSSAKKTKDIKTETEGARSRRTNNKIATKTYSDSDLDCFIKTYENDNTKMNMECKLCLLRFVSQRRAWDHVLHEHKHNLEQSTKTLDLYPDTTKSCRFDSYIYTIDGDSKESIIPAEMFSTPGRGGRKRTPSKKLIESQNALLTTMYVCKICHRKAVNKTSILQHMKRFHIDVLPTDENETKDDSVEEDHNDEEEDEDEGDNEEEEEEDEDDNEVEDEEESEVEDDEDQDYIPSHDSVEKKDAERKPKGGKRKTNTQSELPEVKKRKTNTQSELPEVKKRKIEDDKSEPVAEQEVHVKIEVMPEENDENLGEMSEEMNEEMDIKNESIEENELPITSNRRARFRRSRAQAARKVPSYYVYCDHDESVMDRRSTHNQPFCKTCDRFKCLQCTLTFKKVSHLNRHIRIIHNKEKKYKCTKCDARFTTNESLSYHKKWHTGVKDVECPYCDMKFLVQKSLRKHMNKHHPGLAQIRRKKTNHCEICDSIFTRKEKLEYHMLEKHPANNPDKECRICGQKFETEEQCFSHADAHTDMAKVPVAKCPHCDLYCSSKNNLKRHVDRVHLNIKKYLCNECGKRFKGRDAFLYHVKRHADPHGRDFECNICQKKIATEKGLEIHLRTHSGVKPYVCETCGKGFAQKGNMQSHQAIHFDDRPFECQECFKTFKKKFDLYKHMKRHRIKQVHETGNLECLEGAGKIYECPLEDCKTLFCSTTDLKLHMRRHNNERPYECMICFKTFAVKSRLVRHLKNVHVLDINDSDLENIKSTEWAEKMETARIEYKLKKQKYQTVMIPQPSGEQIEVQIMTDEAGAAEGVEDLLALSNPTTFAKEKVKDNVETQETESQEHQEIQFKIETSDDDGSNIQIINVQEDSTGEVQIHTDDDNIVLDPAIIQTLLSSGQQTIYYYVDQ